MLRLRRKFILERDALEFFAEVSDPIFALLPSNAGMSPVTVYVPRAVLSMRSLGGW